MERFSFKQTLDTNIPAQQVEKDSREKDNLEGEHEYRVMTPEDVSIYKDFAKNKISLWHDKVLPKYIFLTETSAVQYGWLLRSAWKNAYPDEECPKFYRINPPAKSSFFPRLVERKDELNNPLVVEIVKYLNLRRIDKKSPAIIFDEHDSDAALKQSADAPFDRTGKSLKLASNDEYLHNDTLTRVRRVLQEVAGLSNLWTDQGKPLLRNYLKDYVKLNEDEKEAFLREQKGIRDFTEEEYDAFSTAKEFERDEKESVLYINATRKTNSVKGKNIRKRMPSENMFTAQIEKDPELKRRALDYIHDLKKAGEQVGMELHKELEK